MRLLLQATAPDRSLHCARVALNGAGWCAGGAYAVLVRRQLQTGMGQVAALNGGAMDGDNADLFARTETGMRLSPSSCTLLRVPTLSPLKAL